MALKKRPFTELYIHIPFCNGKCDYCAFYSEGKMEETLLHDYLERLFSDMEKYASECTSLHSIYFGGGTPTILPAGKMKSLFEKIRKTFSLEKDAEISMECNPETLTEEKAFIMGTFVNRVSMGVQSFSPLFRERIGRRCGEKDVEKTVGKTLSLLQKNGMENVGFDLIYLLPDQTLADWKKDLQKALSFDIKHLSCYSLTLEEGTPLEKKYAQQGENASLSADMWELAGEYSAEKGFARYEISNYALKNFHCRHNDNIWKGASYLGLGPSACSFDGKDRWMQSMPLTDFLAGREEERDEISDEKRLAEIFIMGLRRKDGWKKEDWEKVASGISLTSFQREVVEKNIRLGLLEEKENTLSPTQKGLEYWNDLAESFL